MPAQTTGISTLTFGVPTKTGYVVQSFTQTVTPAITVEVLNENGQRVAARYDDATKEITVEALINGATLPAPGTIFNYNSLNWETLSTETKGENKGFTSVTIKGKNSEYL